MKMKKRFLSILLSLVMVLGLMIGMSSTAYAETEIYNKLKENETVVNFNGTIGILLITILLTWEERLNYWRQIPALARPFLVATVATITSVRP